jgi:hypothetical protein
MTSEYIKTGPHAEALRLYELRSPARYVDSFGDVTTNQSKYVRVLEVVDTFLNGEARILETGYGQHWDAPIYESSDGRTWLEIQEMVAYSGGRWYRPLFDEPRDPALDKHEIGPRTYWVPENEMKNKRCVNIDGRAVDTEGNIL